MKTKTIIIIFLSIILFFLFFVYILYPSHLSVIASCNPEKFETKYSDYYVAGSITIKRIINETNETEAIIEIYLEDEEDIPLKKHELCHVRQYRMGYLFSCDYPPLKLINEVECYSVQRYYEILELVKIV